ncbi:MAG: hypothetical protein HY394_04380 [Candidatus Diapherotrites archaeon]|nr:hypothetical protein [Candidatus Diapherotrites archaeon]
MKSASAQETVFLDFFGTAFSVECPEQFASWLKHDFSLFVAKPRDNVFLSFKISGETPGAKTVPGAEAVFSNAEYCVFDSPGMRAIDFFGEASAFWDFRKKEISFFSASQETAYARFYTALLAILGRELDQKGMHRIHCAGISRDGNAILFLGEAGMGKTTLALDCLESPSMKLLSDEIVFVGPGLEAFPFLTRIGIRRNSFAGNFPQRFLRGISLPNGSQKILVSALAFKAKVSGPAKVSKIVLLRRNLSQESFVKPAGKLSVFWWLFRKSVFGSELVQEPAYFYFPGLRQGISMLKVYVSRFFLALRLCLFRKCVVFSAGSDRKMALEKIESLFES